MTAAPKLHLLAHGVSLRVAWCGAQYIDPDGDRVTTDKTLVTCMSCRRSARLDSVRVLKKRRQKREEAQRARDLEVKDAIAYIISRFNESCEIKGIKKIEWD